jgi:hypothetical protein
VCLFPILPPDDAAVIENGYQRGNSTIKLRVGSSTYVLDFSSMTQTNASTSTKRAIKRVGGISLLYLVLFPPSFFKFC